MSWAEIKHSVNSTLGTKTDKPLDQIVKKEMYENYYDTFSTYVDVWGDNGGKIVIVPRSNAIDTQAYANSDATRIVIPYGVESIRTNAFASCSSLKNIIVPDSVTYIDHRAFYSCTSLESITLSNSLTSIAEGVFSSCHGLTNIVIPNGVTIINTGAFHDCMRLKSITIPKSLEKIAAGAFSECWELSHVYYGGTKQEWEAITIQGGNDAMKSATIHYNEVI